MTLTAPMQSELTPKDGRALDELYKLAEERERAESVLARMQADVLRERQRKRDARMWTGEAI